MRTALSAAAFHPSAHASIAAPCGLAHPFSAPATRVCEQLVGGDRVTWPPGQSGERTFTLRVTSAPRAGRISARLVDAEGGAVIPAADAEASVVVLSPVLSFVPTKQVRRTGRGLARLRVWGCSCGCLVGLRPR
jgi:hypothetical protein